MKIRSRRTIIAAGTTLATFAVTGVAWAYWTASGSGSASATTGTLNAPTAVTASSTVGTGSVSVSWSAPTAGVTPSGYYVTRTSGSGTAAACGTSAASPTTSTSCTDTSVTDGTYTYQVVAVRGSWTAASSPSGSVTVITTRPDVTVNQAAGQSDPTNASPVLFTATFSESVTDFSGSKVVIGGTAPGTKTASVSGSGANYTISISGMTGPGTVTASIAANTVHDANGGGNTASTSTDNTVTFDATAPAASTPSASAAATSGTAPIYVNSEVVTFTDVASDADTGVASVKYYYCPQSAGSCSSSGTLIGSSNSAAGNYSVSSGAPFAPTDGTYLVVAVVTDNAGNVTTSSALQIALDRVGPTVSAPIVNGNS
jgi:hypothetical protein